MVATPEGAEPIEALRVGDRVRTSDDDETRATEIEPTSWRELHLRMPNPDGSGDVVDVEVLRPAAWTAEVGAIVGGWISFSLPEMGLYGPAEVENISSAPQIRPGTGRVVRVAQWQKELDSVGGFQMSDEARRALERFGGIRVEGQGPGRNFGKGSFHLDPTLAKGEEERFRRPGFSLYPLGEAYDGHAFLGIDQAGAVFLIMDDETRVLGQTIEEAMEALILGKDMGT